MQSRRAHHRPGLPHRAMLAPPLGELSGTGVGSEKTEAEEAEGVSRVSKVTNEEVTRNDTMDTTLIEGANGITVMLRGPQAITRGEHPTATTATLVNHGRLTLANAEARVIAVYHWDQIVGVFETVE